MNAPTTPTSRLEREPTTLYPATTILDHARPIARDLQHDQSVDPRDADARAHAQTLQRARRAVRLRARPVGDESDVAVAQRLDGAEL